MSYSVVSDPIVNCSFTCFVYSFFAIDQMNLFCSRVTAVYDSMSGKANSTLRQQQEKSKERGKNMQWEPEKSKSLIMFVFLMKMHSNLLDEKLLH